MLNLFKKYPSLWVTAIVSLLAHGVIMAWVSDWYESPMTRLQSSAAPSIEIKLMPRVLPLPEKIVALHQPEPEPEILKAPVETPPPPKKISTKKPVAAEVKKHRPLRKPVKRLQEIAKPAPKEAPVIPPVAEVAEMPDQQQLDRIKQAYIQKLLALINQNKFYPRRARRKHQQGLVTVGFGIGSKGAIQNIRLVKSSGVNLLDKSALEVISGLRGFDPLPSALGVASLDLAVPMEYRLQ